MFRDDEDDSPGRVRLRILDMEPWINLRFIHVYKSATARAKPTRWTAFFGSNQTSSVRLTASRVPFIFSSAMAF